VKFVNCEFSSDTLRTVRRADIASSWRHRRRLRRWVVLCPAEVAVVRWRRGAACRWQGEAQPYNVQLSSARGTGTDVPADALPGHLRQGTTGWAAYAARITHTGELSRVGHGSLGPSKLCVPCLG